MLVAKILNNEIFIRMFLSLWFAGMLCFPAMLISRARGSSKKKQEELKARAINLGQVVTADFKKIRTPALDIEPGSTLDHDTVIYTYVWNGRRYKYKTWQKSYTRVTDYHPTLYFVHFPWQAAEEGCINPRRIPWPLRWVLVALFLFVVCGKDIMF